MNKLDYVRSDHKYIFIYGNKNNADKILLLFEYLYVKNEDNAKCDNEDMCCELPLPKGRGFRVAR